MARGSSATVVDEMALGADVADDLLDDIDEFDESEVADILATENGFKPITAYSIDQPRLQVVCNDSDDPALRTRIRFNGGVFLCTKPIHVETLTGQAGIFFENLPPGVPADVCPKNGCRFAPRNTQALIAHIAKHID